MRNEQYESSYLAILLAKKMFDINVRHFYTILKENLKKITIFIMPTTITNRELVRNFKVWREKLLKGEISEIIIPQPHEKILRVSLSRTSSPFELLIQKIHKKPFKHLKRPVEDLF